ncbi:hypothetical protein BGZ49_005653 [Haplosporangium sp. Z 27]|nr:hypothetical protein BGZ49_005653 [Haplosporangium sp. Z 27]
MFTPQPSASIPSTDSDSLYYVHTPPITYQSEILYPHQLEQSIVKSHHLTATTLKQSRSSRLHHQRRSKNILNTTSSSIFGQWDIKIKSEARLQTKAKGRLDSREVLHRGTTAVVATPVANTTLTVDTTGKPIYNNIESQNTTPISSTSYTADSQKENTPVLKSQRRMSSSSNQVASNATTLWTIGQQKSNANNTQSVPSDTAHSSTSNTRPSTSKLGVTSTVGSKVSGVEAKSKDGVDAHSSRSKFLRAFGKFKNKHLSQKNIITNPTSKPFTTPMQLGHEDPLVSTDQGSDSNPRHYDSASMRSYTEPVTPKEDNEQLYDIDMEDSEASRYSYHQDRSASSSLRIKLKNRVHNTLASIKSSSNLKDKAKSQAVSTSTSPSPTSEQPSPTTPQTLADSTSTTTDSQQSNTMLRLAKPFWSFPRVRPESSTSSKLMSWTNNDQPSSMNDSSPRTKPMQSSDLDTIMISPELGPSAQASADEDSDNSIDIILPSDYDDYTQFAELPLKKRKKKQAAAAAAAAAGSAPHHHTTTQDASNKRTQAMKRFLLLQKSTDEKSKVKTEENSNGNTETNLTVPQRNSRKRPKDQDSIEQRQGQEPNKMVKSNSEEPSEWRKAIMKSLHIGKGNQTTRKNQDLKNFDKSSLESPINDVSPLGQPHISQRDSGVYPSDHGTRSKRSDSINSTRSRTLATSSHPGLLATTISKSTNLGTRRETLEMAMRRRRRSSAARSNLYDPETHLAIPPSSTYFDDAASAHVTHTFTSFTLELADLDHAKAVVNNSVTPGLFNFKRQPRLTVSSMNQMDTEDNFKGFDSDGDAMSGYIGDADVSMEEIFVRARTPTKSGEGKDKGKSRESDYSSRRKMSIGDADSDTLPELPTLSTRTRDLNRSSNGLESPKLHRRTASSSSPTLNRKTSRNNLNGSISVDTSPTAPARDQANQLSMDEVASWKPRNTLQQSKPTVLTLNTKPMLTTRVNVVPSGTFLNQRSTHQHQASADTLLPNHLKNFSTASTLSASSGYSAQTLNGNAPLVFQAKEFDPKQDLEPTTPVDLKAMDFDTLLKTAEREQQKGQEERTLKKKKSFQFQNSKPLKAQHHSQSSDRSNIENYSNGLYKNNNTSSSSKSALSALVASAPNLDELRTRTNHNGYGNHSPPNNVNHNRGLGNNGSRFSGLQVQTNRVEQRPQGPSHSRLPISKSAITFEYAESEALANSGDRSNPRSKRIMKKKTSVIKLSGKVQGRREDDGVIRVSVTPTVDTRQWLA